MEGLLGPSDRSPQEGSFALGSSIPLFGSSIEQQNEALSFSNQHSNYFNDPLRSSSLVSPPVSIPNPKRANPIDFLGLHDTNITAQQSIRTPPAHHDRFGSSFSHLATESRTELTALGMNISRAKSSDAPTPETSDPFRVHSPLVWQQSRNSLGLNTFTAVEATYDHLAERGLSPKPTTTTTIPLTSSISETGLKPVLSEPGRLEAKAWPFVDKPPGLLSRATSSLGISQAQTSSLLNGLTRPLSTPAYLNKHHDSLSALGFSLTGSNTDSLFLNLGGSSNEPQQRSLSSHEQHQHQHPHRLDNLGSELPSALNFGGLSLESNHHPHHSHNLHNHTSNHLNHNHSHNNNSHSSLMSHTMLNTTTSNEESRWPKPVRYGRALDSSESLLGSILRPPSSDHRSSGLSPLSNSERVSISPKLLSSGEKNIMESKILALSREHTPPPPPPSLPASSSRLSPKLSINAVDDRAIENVIATNCHHILFDAAEHSLKAVELANTLRARVGTEVLAIVRERWGGLLSLLERHPEKFFVERIPKNDRVSLYTSKHAIDSPNNRNNNSNNSNTGGEGELAVATTEGKDLGGEGGEDLENADSQPASRCLHVGNVPTNFTEVQLMKEFEKFGQLDGLKLITQKNGNRRFAFVTFKTVSQAITARHCLSKVHPWKSAISFAHRDFTNNNKPTHPLQPPSQSQSNPHNSNSNGSSQHHHQYQHPSQNHLTTTSNNGYSNSNNHHNHHPKGSPKKPEQYHSPHQQYNHHMNHHNNAHLTNNSHSHRISQPPPPQSYHPSHIPSNPSGNTTTHHFSDLRSSGKSMPSLPFPSTTSTSEGVSQPRGLLQQGSTGGSSSNSSTLIGTHPAIESFSDKNALQIIRSRLCDDTYVPTQPWPVDATADSPFCQAVIDQVSYFGGSATISKLRGFLKHRVGTVDNIKSVPLKALLLAYPHYFKIEGNLVTLLTATSTSIPAIN